MKDEVTQLQINEIMMKIMAEQTAQIKVMAQGLEDLNKRLKALQAIDPKSFL